MSERERESVCVLCIYSYCLLGDNGRLQYLRLLLFFEMYANVVFVRSCLYSAVSLTLGENSALQK